MPHSAVRSAKNPPWGVLVLALAAAGASLGAQDVLEGGSTKIVFHPSRRALALIALGETAEAEARVAATLGVRLRGPKTVELVADQTEMDDVVRRMTGSGAPDWAGAVALPAGRLVVLRADVARKDERVVRALLTHEYAHLALADSRGAAGRGAEAMPRWVEEGLAQYAAGRLRLDEAFDLRPAAYFDRLMDRDELNDAFRGGEGAARRAYAQSESFIRFLSERYGTGVPSRITAALHSGSSLDATVGLLGGLPFASEWDAWKSGLASDRSWMGAALGQFSLAFGALVVVALVIRRRRMKNAAIEARWAAEEAFRKALVADAEARAEAASASASVPATDSESDSEPESEPPAGRSMLPRDPLDEATGKDLEKPG